MLLLRLYAMLRRRLHEIFSIRDTTDVEGTVSSISKGIELKGENVWVLIASAIIASIGLDQSSPAVVIGAMLISPLMNPILGIGLSVGINDRVMLMRSLRNFGLAIGLSIGASMLYFLITPLGDPTPELVSRTRPTLLDVGVALFGGVAGIVANSRIEKTNAIPGVAIATALMPPLCTTGFGIATGNAEFLFGAFYLFFINSVFIALATFLIVKYLEFPAKEQLNAKAAKRVKRYITAFVLVVIIPSGWIFYGVIKDVREQQNIDTFITERVNTAMHEVVEKQVVESDTARVLKLLVIGPNPLEPEEIDELKNRMPEYGLDDLQLNIIQSTSGGTAVDPALGTATLQLMTQMEERSKVISEKDKRILMLEAQLEGLLADTVPIVSIGEEVGEVFPDLERLAYAPTISSDLKGGADTLDIFLVRWRDGLPKREKEEEGTRLRNFLKKRIDSEELQLIDVE